jgi:hypothetical protein
MILRCGSDEEISQQPVYPSTAEAPEWGFRFVPGRPARSGKRCIAEEAVLEGVQGRPFGDLSSILLDTNGIPLRVRKCTN